MTQEKCQEVLGRYRRFFERNQIQKNKYPANINDIALFVAPGEIQARGHLHAMLDEMDQFLIKGEREKFMRWLGFMQGVLWALGDYTLEELKNHNRP